MVTEILEPFTSIYKYYKSSGLVRGPNHFVFMDVNRNNTLPPWCAYRGPTNTESDFSKIVVVGRPTGRGDSSGVGWGAGSDIRPRRSRFLQDTLVPHGELLGSSSGSSRRVGTYATGSQTGCHHRPLRRRSW